MLSIICSLLFAQQPIEIKGRTAQFITLTAPSLTGDVIKYVTLDNLSVFPSDLLSDKKKTVVVAAKAGSYKIIAYSAKDNVPSDPVIITLTISADDATVIPPIYDEILDKLRDVYKKETSDTKEQDIKDMSYVIKCSMQLSYEMLSDYQNYCKTNLSNNKSLTVKKAVSEMMAKEFGTEDVKMDEVQQTKVNKFVLRIAAALDQIIKN